MNIDNKELVVSGRIIKVVKLAKEFYEDIDDPEKFLLMLKKAKIKADVFTFLQSFPAAELQYNYKLQWDNVAAITIKDYNYWFEKQIPKQTRTSLRKAQERGLITRVANFDDDLIKGIVDIYNETPIRQGKLFLHFGKDFQSIKEDMSQDLEKSEFIGAYYNSELIGFVKILYGHTWARTVNIISKIEHRDKSPNNLLIAKAVEACCKNNKTYLIYGKYEYGNDTESSLTNFKRRNGFERIDIPRYYVPMTLKGEIALKYNLHDNFVRLIPKGVKDKLLFLRTKWYLKIYKKSSR